MAEMRVKMSVKHQQAQQLCVEQAVHAAEKAMAERMSAVHIQQMAEIEAEHLRKEAQFEEYAEKAAATLGRANQALTLALQRAHSNMQIGRQPAEHVRVDKVQVA